MRKDVRRAVSAAPVRYRCVRCEDTGREEVDLGEKRPGVGWCQHCHMFCKGCRSWVVRAGHECSGVKTA
jgi:hypothetical protein